MRKRPKQVSMGEREELGGGGGGVGKRCTWKARLEPGLMATTYKGSPPDIFWRDQPTHSQATEFIEGREIIMKLLQCIKCLKIKSKRNQSLDD